MKPRSAGNLHVNCHMAHPDEDLAFAPVHKLAADLDGRKLSSKKLTEACLARIEKHDGKLHAFVAVYADEALRAARAADEAIAAGHRLGPFHGLSLIHISEPTR